MQEKCYTKYQCIICAIYTLTNGVKRYILLLERGDSMSIKYKMDILTELKANGYNTTRLRKEKLLGESTIQQLREGKLVSWANIDRLCRLLECQVGDVVEYVEGE